LFGLGDFHLRSEGDFDPPDVDAPTANDILPPAPAVNSTQPCSEKK
jgi:hypothetical protein